MGLTSENAAFDIVLAVAEPLSAAELSALERALLAVEGAQDASFSNDEALGASAREFVVNGVVAVALGVTANFTTDAVKAAIDEAGLSGRCQLEDMIPAAPAAPRDLMR